MQKIFTDTRPLDSAARERYMLSEDVMMENAARALEEQVFDSALQSVLILCGSGNNGADGYTLARRLKGVAKSVIVVSVYEAKTPMCVLQKKRAELCGIAFFSVKEALAFLENVQEALAIVDCIFGSGFHGTLSKETEELLKRVNASAAYKIACDIATGLDINGNLAGEAFKADVTVTMGALKLALFSNAAKDFCGKIVCVPLGVSREVFEASCKTSFFLLEKTDFISPCRTVQNVHKGTFGHAAVVVGNKPGAAVLACKAAFRFGAGLVSLVCGGREESLYALGGPELLYATSVPKNISALALGMGLGKESAEMEKSLAFLQENTTLPCVFDADILYAKELPALLCERSKVAAPTVLTPHPKEFCALLKNCGLGSFSVLQAESERNNLVQAFCQKYENTVLLLKGATVVIGNKAAGKEAELFFNPHGSSALAKAGSGDVLAGLVVSLLAQNFPALAAAQTASLAHALSGSSVHPNFSLTPERLIEALNNY